MDWPPRTACWYCRHFGGLIGPSASCVRTRQMRSLPHDGCSAFEREPGADDDRWCPPGQEENPHLANMQKLREQVARVEADRAAAAAVATLQVIALVRRRGPAEPMAEATHA